MEKAEHSISPTETDLCNKHLFVNIIKTIFESIFMKKQVNKFIFLNRVTPLDLYHRSAADLQLVFWLANSSEDSVKSNRDTKKMCIDRIGFEKYWTF